MDNPRVVGQGLWSMRTVPPALAPTAALCGFALLAGSCSPGSSAALNIVTIGDGHALFAGAEVTRAGTLDDGAGMVRSATAEGLVAFDARGRVIPALADRWIVLDDGQSYIFRLRDGTWRDGAPLSAASAQAALRAAIARTKGSSLAIDLGVITEIRAMAARVLEIRLRQPMPELLQLLAQPELGLLRRSTGAGPMTLTRAQGAALLVPIDPETIGLPQVLHWRRRMRDLRVESLTGQDAVHRFERGETDLMLGGRVATYPLAGGTRIARGAIQRDPVNGLFGLAVVSRQGILAQADIREALAMAIDRDALVAAFGIGGWAATTRIVPAGIEDDPGSSGERWTGMPIEERRRRARAIIAASASARDGTSVRPVRLALPQGPGADLLFERLRQDLGTIGVPLIRVPERAAADLRLLDAVARFPRTAWFLNSFNCRLGAGPCDPGTDALMAQANAASDPETTARMLAEALASLTAANVFIPLATPLRWSLVRGNPGGFAVNATGVHPLMPMSYKPT